MLRYTVLRCGRRWGKTRLVFSLALKYLAKFVPVAYIAPTYTDLTTRWAEAQEFYAPLINYSSEDKGSIRLKGTGAPFDWYGLHRYDGIRGNKYGLVIVDEAAHAPGLQDAWTNAIRPTLLDYKGDAIFSSTPKYGSYFNDVLCKNEGPNWRQLHYSSYTNPFLSHDEIEQARIDTPSIIFAQEYLAELVVLQGARIKREWLRYADPPEGAPVTLGVDLAISKGSQADYSAIVAVAKHNERYYIVDVVRERLSFHETVEAIKNMAEKWKALVVTIETVAYQAAVVQELIRNTTLPIKAARPVKDKITRFIPTEGKYEHGHIYHGSSLPRYVEEEVLQFPNGAHDDIVDALGYAIGGHANTFFAFSA